MVFSSSFFLFLFLPLFLIIYVLGGKLRNYIYLLFSLVFFFIGEGWFIAVMLTSITVNYFTAFYIEKSEDDKKRLNILWAGIVINLSMLIYYKYLGFIFNSVFMIKDSFANDIHLVLGISFFTFQGLSYIIDVWRREISAQRDFGKLALYISMFPQLIAGPIVRYQSIQHEMNIRSVTLSDVYHGVAFFVLGLSAKVLIADQVAGFADTVFTDVKAAGSLDMMIGTVAYSLQIFFDFAGYSGMAIGLGRLTGFYFPQNFDYPYVAKSITEFWRRWHISLSTWFRDYVYIPLGGNRGGEFATYRNLLIVFTVTGIWHGAAWNFMIWGWWHGMALVAERMGFGKVLAKIPSIFAMLYTLIWAMLGWVFFRAENLPDALYVIQNMITFGDDRISYTYLFYNTEFILAMIIGIMLAFQFPRHWLEYIMVMPNYFKVTEDMGIAKWRYILSCVIFIILFALCVIKILSGSFSPFIYFRF